MSILPVSIGLSISDKKCYYLSWIPSESGPLIISFGDFKRENDSIPFDYLLNKIKDYNVSPRFSISLNNSFVKYDFFKSYSNSSIDNWNKDNFYDKSFHNSYHSYSYEYESNIFSIHILSEIRDSIISQSKKQGHSLINLGVGIFSALEGVKYWYKIDSMDQCLIVKFSKNKIIELLMVNNNNFSSYMILKKWSSNIKIINYFGPESDKNKLLKLIESIFNGDIDLIKFRVFFYSVNGNKKDISLFSNFDSEKIQLINPFSQLTFDDSCDKKIKDIDASSYSELGNLFRGVDV